MKLSWQKWVNDSDDHRNLIWKPEFFWAFTSTHFSLLWSPARQSKPIDPWSCHLYSHVIDWPRNSTCFSNPPKAVRKRAANSKGNKGCCFEFGTFCFVIGRSNFQCWATSSPSNVDYSYHTVLWKQTMPNIIGVYHVPGIVLYWIGQIDQGPLCYNVRDCASNLKRNGHFSLCFFFSFRVWEMHPFMMRPVTPIHFSQSISSLHWWILKNRFWLLVEIGCTQFCNS